MTSYAKRRCIHCNDVYDCLRSGHGFPQYGNHSNPKYCSGCYKIIQDALQRVPQKYEKRTVDVVELPEFADITWEMVAEWENQWRQTCEKENRLQIQQIGVPLYNLGDPENHNNSRKVVCPDGKHKGIGFWLNTWSKTPEQNVVSVDMEYDIRDKKITGVWTTYDYD
jgi:hypothetical protein